MQDPATDGPGSLTDDEVSEPTVAGPPQPDWVTVSAGGERSAGYRPVRTGRIMAQVAAAAAVVVVVVGVLGAVASRNVAERQAVNDAATITDLLAEAVVMPALDDSLLTFDAEATARLDSVVRSRVLGTSISRVKLWTPDGVIVYSDDPEAIGDRFALGEEERQALLEPMTHAEVSDLTRPENRSEAGQDKLLEVYQPVWTPTGQPLLFETYAPYDSVAARTGELWRGFAGITLSSMLLLVVLLMPVIWRLTDRLRTAQSQREQLLQRAVDASAEERQRIAAHLHDGVVQELAVSSFAVAGAAEQADTLGHRGLADQLRGVLGTVRASIGGLRSLLVDIYPASLRTAGLRAALEDTTATLRSRGVEVDLDVPPYGRTGLDPAAEELVFRVAQECLRNVAGHAHARRVTVSLTRDGRDHVLDVVDDGVGFDAERALADPEEGHFGLRILADLAASAGATLDVRTGPGAGTHWRMRLPAS
ncbi:MAG: sensor histidine kinase [Candidatus Nanopelagicales bacterium]